MIVTCPTCGARARLDRVRLTGKRVKLRCSRCSEVYQVAVTEDEAVAAKPPASLTVLVAHSDPALCAAVGEVFSEHADITWHACHDGDEALLAMERFVPQVAVVDVALPGLFAFELVEKVRKRQNLRDVKLILLSSVYNKMAYKRTPNSLYGADDYIEKHHVPTDLVRKIRTLTGTSNPTPVPPQAVAPSSVAAQGERIQEVNNLLRHAEESEIESHAGSDEAGEKAARLARIIVSDIALYNQERVEEGIRCGTFFELLTTEIEEGRRLFRERVAAELPGREEILQQTFENFVERRRREMSL